MTRLCLFVCVFVAGHSKVANAHLNKALALDIHFTFRGYMSHDEIYNKI